MYKSVFLDANVLVDAYDPSRVYHRLSRESIAQLLGYDTVSLFTSCDIMTTLYYIFAKQDKEKALSLIKEINEWCQVVEFGNSEIRECVSLMKGDKVYKDLEDTIQYVMAKKAGCDLILSNDKGFVSPDIMLMSIEKFLASRE